VTATPREEIERVARKLWGEPNREQSSKRELRFGTGGARSVDLDKVVWFDFEAWEGGGLASLCQRAGEPITSDSGPDSIVAIYPYRDEHGAPLFQVVRKLPKKFVQRRLDPAARDGWAWNLRGVRRVLYRLPELLAADPALPVFIPEGEKDVDNLRSKGLVATCNPGGAGKWWREFSEYLRDRSVVILPDNDQAGHDHAADVARKLAGIVRSIRIVDLPNLPKGDISDWFSAGGTVETLNALVAKAATVTSENGTDTSGDGAELTDAEFHAEIARLARLPLAQYERQRKASAKLLGIRAPGLERLVEIERGDDVADTKGQGRPLDLPLPEPWSEPVDGLSLCTELVAFFRDHATLPDRGAIALTLWVIHTFCYVLWRYTPRLHITGPTKRCGKSRVLRLLQLLVCKPLASSSVSASAVYRSIEAVHPTLLVDEADQSVKDKPDLIAVLDGGYERGQVAIRTVGEEHEPRAFDLFAPVALAGIGRLAGQLEDRSIRLPMRRALPSEKSAKITVESETRGERLQRQIARWVSDHRQALTDATPDVSALPDRIDDHWTPLYAIASAVGDNWPTLAAAAVKALAADDDDTDSLGEQLIHDIQSIRQGQRTAEHITSRDLTDLLVNMEGRPWAEMGRSRRALTTNRLARLLKPFKVYSRLIGDARTHGYLWSHFDTAFEHYPTRASDEK
jgi:putative DNA primase/helicase